MKNQAAVPSSFVHHHRRHRRTLQRAARRTWRRLPSGVDLDDVEQEARIALMETLRRQDDARAPLAGHLKRRLQWAMGDLARRSYRRLDPSRGAPTFAARSYYDGHRRASDPPRPEAMELAELCLSEEASPEEQLIEHDLRRRLRAAITTLPPRERAVATGHYVRGLSMSEVARSLRMSPSAVSRLHRRIIRILTKRLRAEPHTPRAATCANASQRRRRTVARKPPSP